VLRITGGRVGFIDKTRKVVIEQQYDKVRDFKNGYAAVRQGEKWGFIDTAGKWVIEPTFDGVKDFEKTGNNQSTFGLLPLQSDNQNNYKY
tara:strand:+ start:370 stop:639 length:270 start_codon:yes stop_codon:yes gene_type:complete